MPASIARTTDRDPLTTLDHVATHLECWREDATRQLLTCSDSEEWAWRNLESDCTWLAAYTREATYQASEEIFALKQALQAILYEATQPDRDASAIDRIRMAAQAAIL
jgi:hypothetical protein